MIIDENMQLKKAMEYWKYRYKAIIVTQGLLLVEIIIACKLSVLEFLELYEFAIKWF